MFVRYSEREAAGSSESPGPLPRRHAAPLYLVCCTALQRVIMWNPDWSAVISDVHRTLRNHRSLPLREVGFVCVREREKLVILLTYPSPPSFAKWLSTDWHRCLSDSNRLQVTRRRWLSVAARCCECTTRGWWWFLWQTAFQLHHPMHVNADSNNCV